MTVIAIVYLCQILAIGDQKSNESPGAHVRVAVPVCQSHRDLRVYNRNAQTYFISAMSASTSKPSDSLTKVNEQTKEEDSQPTLGVLEEDDEFEEFAVAGELSRRSG